MFSINFLSFVEFQVLKVGKPNENSRFALGLARCAREALRYALTIFYIFKKIKFWTFYVYMFSVNYLFFFEFYF